VSKHMKVEDLEASLVGTFKAPNLKMLLLKECLETVIDFRGKNPPKAECGIPLITARHIRKGHLDDQARFEYVSQQYFDHRFKSKMLKPRDILFTTEAPLGNVAYYPDNGTFAVAQRVMALRVRQEVLLPDYLLQFLLSDIATQQLERLSTGTTAKGIKQSVLLKLQIPVPSIEVQGYISSLLNTWDKINHNLSSLIARKRRLKQGLMQQLLTGKKRFPEFAGTEWKEYRLGDLFTERVESNREDLTLLSITADRGVITRSDLGKKDTSSQDKSKYLRICPGDIGYNTMRMWQGVSALSTLEGIVSPAYTIVVPSSEIDGEFASYLFKLPLMVSKFWRYSQGLVSDTLNLKYPNFTKIRVSIPALAEQKKIAALLKDSDSEIFYLEKQLELIQKQKRGLMEQLLTSKIKLSDREACNA